MSLLDLFPLGRAILPGQAIPLRIFEPRYLAMIRACREAGLPFGVCLIREGSEVGPPAIPHTTGTAAAIESFREASPEMFHLVARGTRRFRVHHIVQEQPHVRAVVDWIDPPEPIYPGDYARLRTALARIVERIPPSPVGLPPPTLPAGDRQLLGFAGTLLAAHPLQVQWLLERTHEELVTAVLETLEQT